MARKKKDSIEGLGKDTDKLTVQKSTPLFSLWRSDLTLTEFKILDIYLSRIDSHKPENRTVTFTKGEMEEILGVQKINVVNLKARTEHLLGRVVEISDSSVEDGYDQVVLFEEASAKPDKEDGLWEVKLKCTETAKKYFFNVEQLGYLRYKLRCITSLTSRYAYILFLYLESNRFRKSWEVPLEELKEILSCEDDDIYNEYKYFNQRILKKIHEELESKTECRYTYEPIRKGRKVARIRFTLKTIADTILPIQATEVPADDQVIDYSNMDAAWNTSERAKEFADILTEDQYNILIELIKSKGITSPDGKLRYYVDYMDYEAKKRKKPVNNKFSYLKKCIENDKSQVEEPKTDSFHSSINYDELENIGVFMDMDK